MVSGGVDVPVAAAAAAVMSPDNSMGTRLPHYQLAQKGVNGGS